jgi:5-formyltetrahydrofolate cyclo-ligase
MNSKSAEKSVLRKKYLALRKNLSPEFRAEADKEICSRLIELGEIEKTAFIGAYMTDGTEPDLGDFLKFNLKKGKKICLPRENSETGMYEMSVVPGLSGNELVPGAYGIIEPAPECPALSDDLYNKVVWLVPGVSFDTEGRRLGRGKAVYDCLLAKSSGLKIGVFYECQQDAAVPEEEHDYRLDMIVTEKQVYRCNKKMESTEK